MIAGEVARLLMIGVLFGVFCLPKLFSFKHRTMVLLLILFSMLDWAALFQFFAFHLKIPGAHFNWVGKAVDIVFLVTVASGLILAKRLTTNDIGLTFAQAPGTGRALVFVALPFLLIMAAITYLHLLGPPGPAPDLQAIAYQATMPGLAEELGYRGVFLAMMGRIMPSAVRIGGAPIGFGVLVTSLIFGLMHGVNFDPQLNVSFDVVPFAMSGGTGLVLAWIRLRTGSLVLPIAVHNATNLILILVRPG